MGALRPETSGRMLRYQTGVIGMPAAIASEASETGKIESRAAVR